MQKVKMLKTLPGVLEGEIYPRTFKADEEYEINDSLVRGFMEQGGCEILDHDPAARQTKVTGPAEPKLPPATAAAGANARRGKR